MFIPIQRLSLAAARKVFDLACAEALACGLLLWQWDEDLAIDLRRYFEGRHSP